MTNTAFNDFVGAHKEELSTTTSHKAFLGQEFLTWLWFFAETEAGEFEIKTENRKSIKSRVWLEDRVSLSTKVGLSHDHVIKGGNPSTCQEAGLALRLGKTVQELRIGLELEDLGSYSLVLNAADLSPRSIVLPEPQEDNEESPLEQRLDAISLLSLGLNSLTKKFLSERAEKVWDNNRLESIRTWIKTRSKGRDGVIH
jgi:hypothetical protein